MFDVSDYRTPLPDDIRQLRDAGYFEEELSAIDSRLESGLPSAMRRRLALEKEAIRILRIGEYPFDLEHAASMMENSFEGFRREELDRLRKESAVDWIYREARPYFQKAFLDNLIKTRPDYRERLKDRSAVGENDRWNALLSDNVERMKEKGGRTARITLEASIRVKKEYERAGGRVLVHLPVPKPCEQVSEIRILNAGPESFRLAPEDAEQRTICFETDLRPDQVFSVRYSYLNHVDYVELDPEKAAEEQPDFCLEEQAPHILFTAFLRELLREILGGERNPVRKARKIYDFVTTKVRYSFVRSYILLENISEYAARNLKGDCGVQAILFITLCRMAGIPARWQSGLVVSELHTGCHDWAQFYAAPYGWVFADPSFGGSACRQGDAERWNYYFGNLDIFRMPANSAIQSEFEPPKRRLRADPIDNQTGEIEYEDCGLLSSQVETKAELVSLEEVQPPVASGRILSGRETE